MKMKISVFGCGRASMGSLHDEKLPSDNHKEVVVLSFRPRNSAGTRLRNIPIALIKAAFPESSQRVDPNPYPKCQCTNIDNLVLVLNRPIISKRSGRSFHESGSSLL